MTKLCATCNGYNRANNHANQLLLSSLRCLVNKQKLYINDSKSDNSRISDFWGTIFR